MKTDDCTINKILNIIDYYIDNNRYDIKSNWVTSSEGNKISSRCVGFTISSNFGYTILCSLIDEKVVSLEIVDRYSSALKLMSDEKVYYEKVLVYIDRILNDSTVSVLERMKKENREININKVL